MSQSTFEEYRRGYLRGFQAAKAPHGLTPDDLAAIDWLLEQSNSVLNKDPGTMKSVLLALRKKIEGVVLPADAPTPTGIPRPPLIPALPDDNTVLSRPRRVE